MGSVAKYLRCNYRLTGGKTDAWATELQSILVKLQVTVVHESDAGDVETFSLQGYGVPAIVLAWPQSALTFTFLTKIRTSITSGTSLIYLTVDGASGSMGSAAATSSMRYNVLALIASR